MAQHDYDIANQGFPEFRTDLNNALDAIQTNNSGTAAPSSSVDYQVWIDTSTAGETKLKYRVSGTYYEFLTRKSNGDITLGDGALTSGNGTVSVDALTVGGNTPDSFPSGTRLLFQNSTAPTGWTDVSAAYDQSTIRITGGAFNTSVQGSVNFTSAFTSRAITGVADDHILTTAQIPAHVHYVNITTASNGDHSHSAGTLSFLHQLDNAPSGSAVQSMVPSGRIDRNQPISGNTAVAGAHTHAVQGNTQSTGGATAHSHTLSIDNINLAVKYTDFILCEKD